MPPWQCGHHESPHDTPPGDPAQRSPGADSTVWQMLSAMGHRGWNGHPGGGLAGSGTSPATEASSSPAALGSGTGTASRSAFV